MQVLKREDSGHIKDHDRDITENPSPKLGIG